MSEEMNRDRRRFLRMAARTIAAIPLGVIAAKNSQLATEADLPSLEGATGWLNSQRLTRADLRGRVLLVDFWTYSCINWRRTLPYVRAWAKKYKDHGLLVVGVHTPEFEFEKDVDNVRQAVKAMKIDYPVAMDNEYAVWRAFHNEYWPALYFVDAQGHVRATKFGEGDYDQSERAIQQLLTRAGAGGFGRELVSVDVSGAELRADWDNLRSPETYVGYERTERFASPGGLKARKCHTYALPARLKLNGWALAGNWTAERQTTVLQEANGRIAYQFHARDLHLVMGPAVRGASVRFRVLIDGGPPGAAHGIDVDDQGNGAVSEPRMYQLIRQAGPIVDRKFEIEFLDPSVEAFSFTFG